MARHTGHRHGAKAGRSDRAVDPGATLLWGVHSVSAALDNPRRVVRRLLTTEGGFARVADAAARRGVAVERVDEAELGRRLPREAVHQGIVLEADPLRRLGLEEAVIDSATSPKLVVVLDQVTDPHNLGAILRSAAAFGAIAVIVQERHSPPMSGTVAKAASGALDRVAVVEVVNISRAIGPALAGLTIAK